MTLRVSGKNMDVGDALRTRAEGHFDTVVNKYFDGGYTGHLTLEPEGPGFNEMAPRVHNSGHWTIEGAVTSQFENHVRAICGLPLGDTALVHPRVEMRNLIGREIERAAEILQENGAHLHHYGKGEAREGRKMGHVTWVRP